MPAIMYDPNVTTGLNADGTQSSGSARPNAHNVVDTIQSASMHLDAT